MSTFSIGGIVSLLLQFFLLCLFARIILDYIRIFNNSWRPKGVVLWIAEIVYSITDPLIKFARRYIPPLRLGPVAVDLSFLVIFFGVQMLISLTRYLP
jgi:YggT family protein